MQAGVAVDALVLGSGRDGREVSERERKGGGMEREGWREREVWR